MDDVLRARDLPILDKLAEAFPPKAPNLLSWLPSSCLGQPDPFTFWNLSLCWMEMIQRNLHFHPCPSIDADQRTFCQPIFQKETQSLTSCPYFKMFGMPSQVTSTYTAQACLWRLHFATEDRLKLVCSWIGCPCQQSDFLRGTDACSCHSCCFNSSGYFFNFYPGLRAV